MILDYNSWSCDKVFCLCTVSLSLSWKVLIIIIIICCILNLKDNIQYKTQNPKTMRSHVMNLGFFSQYHITTVQMREQAERAAHFGDDRL